VRPDYEIGVPCGTDTALHVPDSGLLSTSITGAFHFYDELTGSATPHPTLGANSAIVKQASAMQQLHVIKRFIYNMFHGHSNRV
jgi:hypothetical protein